VTLVLIGVGLAERGLFSEGDSYTNAVLTQTGRRTTALDMRPVTVNTDTGRREWRQMLLAIGQRLALAERHPGMLADEVSDYLFARSTGRIGSMMTLVNCGWARRPHWRRTAEPGPAGSRAQRRRRGNSPPRTGRRDPGPPDHDPRHPDNPAPRRMISGPARCRSGWLRYQLRRWTDNWKPSPNA
jgi:hypothetical protein